MVKPQHVYSLIQAVNTDLLQNLFVVVSGQVFSLRSRRISLTKVKQAKIFNLIVFCHQPNVLFITPSRLIPRYQ